MSGAPWAAVSLTFNSDRDKNPSPRRWMIQAGRDDSAVLYFAVAISGGKSVRSPSLIALIVQRAHSLTGQCGGTAANARQHAARD